MNSYKILWHGSFISLYSSFDKLKKLLGQNLTDLCDQDQEHILEWARSADSLRCVLHAMAIKSIAERQLFADRTAFFIPRTLLQAVVVLFVIIKHGVVDTYGLCLRLKT